VSYQFVGILHLSTQSISHQDYLTYSEYTLTINNDSSGRQSSHKSAEKG